MSGYIISRIIQAIPLIFSVIIFNFILIRLAPGGPAYILAGDRRLLPIEFVERINREFGLDRPLYEQLFLYISNVFHGELGISYYFREPVISIIMERIPATALLMGTQFIISFLVGVGLAVLVYGMKRLSVKDYVGQIFSMLAYSTPTFWLGFILILLFSIQMKLLPASGITTPGEDFTGLESMTDVTRHLLLPAITLSLTGIAIYFGLMKTSLKESLGQDYITLARSKGLDERRILFGHALRNSLLPVVSITGMNVGVLLSGTILVETVFAWPGLGKLVYDAFLARDLPIIMGVFIVLSISVIIANLVTDIIYGIIDPRIRQQNG
ncbi:MAG: ABC transporter permease [Nitrososphaeraceae archaeon]